jgi:hypothetical protein
VKPKPRTPHNYAVLELQEARDGSGEFVANVGTFQAIDAILAGETAAAVWHSRRPVYCRIFTDPSRLAGC